MKPDKIREDNMPTDALAGIGSKVSSDKLSQFFKDLENVKDLSEIENLFWLEFNEAVKPSWGCFYWHHPAERNWSQGVGSPKDIVETLPEALEEDNPAVEKVCRLKMAGTRNICELSNRYLFKNASFKEDSEVLLLAFSGEKRTPAFLAIGPKENQKRYSLSDIFFMHQLIGICYRAYERTELSLQMLTADKEVTVSMVAAGIAHEINNNIMPIIGRAQLIDRSLRKIQDQELVRELRNNIKIIFNQGSKIARIAVNLKKLSQPVKLQIQELSLEEEIRATVEILSETAGKIKHFKVDDPASPLKLKMDFEPDLPRISGDSQQLQQVFINLIINAAHAIEENQRGILTVGAKARPEKHVVAFIKDDGIGMTPETMRKLWEPFYTTKKEGKGTGLGMAIVKNVIKAHEGEIKVESEFGKGTLFELVFKAAD